MSERDPRVLVPGKETVVRAPGADWAFHLPERHTIEVSDDVVALATPLEGSTYELRGMEEVDDEVVVRLGAELGRHGPPSSRPEVAEARGYPLPAIQEEFERLRGRWKQAGLPEQEFNAYPQGATHEDQLRALRRKLREARASRGA